MNYLSNRQGFFASSINLLLTVYLCLALIGCGKPPPPPTTEQVRQLETRVFDANYDIVFKATMNTLQDMGYSIDGTDKESGLITAERYSEGEFAKIFSTEEEIPTWMYIACIITGVIVLAVVVLAITAILDGDDDDKDEKKKKKQSDPKKETRDKDSDKKEGKKEGNNEKKREEQKRKEEQKRREEQKRKEEHRRREEGRRQSHKKGSSSTTTTIFDLGINLDFDPPQEEYYYYRMTLNLKELEDNSTNVRISLQGSHIEGEDVKKTGSVYDARFFELFFVNLNQALKVEKGEVTP